MPRPLLSDVAQRLRPQLKLMVTDIFAKVPSKTGLLRKLQRRAGWSGGVRLTTGCTQK